MYKTFATTSLLAFALPAMAAAQAQYSAEEIEKHFSAPKPEAECAPGQICLPKATSRGVCIGAASKCGTDSTQTARVEPEGFDLLITFELGSDRLSPQAKENLAEFARALNGDALKNVQFNVDGHTDASGSDTYNLSLSERRAASVVNFLKEQGIDPSLLTAKGHGESAPRDSSDPFAAINRRVEATVRTQ